MKKFDFEQVSLPSPESQKIKEIKFLHCCSDCGLPSACNKKKCVKLERIAYTMTQDCEKN